MRSKTIKVLIADDHALIRQGLKQILELDENIKVIAQATNGEEAFQLAQELNPDVVLLDINMPKLNGIETLKKFRNMGVSSKVIILTIHEDKEYILKTLKLGADGYLLKDSSADNLIEGIKMVYSGEQYIQTSVMDIVSKSPDYDEYLNENIDKIQLLTNREYEVLILIAEGMNNKDIADSLFISEKTVKNHVSSIFKKLELNDRVQAAIFAYKNNIKKL